MKAWFRFVLRHRFLFLGLCALITVLAVLSITRTVLHTDFASLFFSNNEKFDRYLERTEQFAPDVFHVLAYEDPEPLSLSSLDRLERIHERIGSLQGVARVESLLGAHSLKRLTRYSTAARKNPEEAQILMKELAEDPLLGGLLISKDGKHVAVVVEFEPDANMRVLVPAIPRIFHKEGIAEEKLHQAGIPAVCVECYRQSIVNIWVLSSISAVLLLFVVFALFRRSAPAFVSLGVAILAATWTMGFYAVLDRQISILATMVPIVILVVSFSDVIHLWSAYLVELKNGRRREEAILCSASDVGRACLLTSVTTFMGFVCLSLVPTPAFRLLGLVLGFGVAIALLLAMTLVPILLSFLKPPPVEAGSRANDLLDRVLSGLTRLTTRRPGWVAAGSAAVLVLSVYGVFQIHVETDFLKRLKPDNPIRVDHRYFQEHFHGTNTLEIFVELPRKEALHDPSLLAKIQEFEDEVCGLKAVDSVLSVLDVVSLLHARFAGANAPPITAKGYRFYLNLLQDVAGVDLKRAVDLERGVLRLAVRLNVGGAVETYRTGLAVEAVGQRVLGDAAKVEATGIVSLTGWWIHWILEGQKRGVVLSMALVTVVMMLGLRSLRVGLVSLIPNLLPVLVVGGYVGLFWDQVDSDTFTGVMIAISIGVDDTIHFLMRYRIERRRSMDSAQALKRTFAFAGRAIVMTTVVLTLGFIPFGFSDYFTITMMGTLLPAVLVVALLADLLTVPAMVRLGWIDFTEKEEKESVDESSTVIPSPVVAGSP
ncbi:MAG: efflux RND transporter permease subunit [Planctomycetota bacterium]|jgi:predicted RND superfamily exporter protein